MASPKIELLLDCHAVIGESPTWFAPRQTLFWIDVKEPALYCMASGESVQRTGFESDVGAFALREDASGVVVALRSGVSGHDFASGVTTLLAPSPFDPDRFRFNEGICDARGRFWIGVMLDPMPGHRAARPDAAKTAALHCYTDKMGLVVADDYSDLHNGTAWSVDGRLLYLSHSNQGTVDRYGYNLEDGTLGQRHPYIAVHGPGLLPDGAAVDEDGCYWCAMHGAGVLHRYDASGRLVDAVALPISQPTMCAFTGANLDEMVVTSAADKLTPAQLKREPHAGGLFHLRPGVRGIPRPCIVF